MPSLKLALNLGAPDAKRLGIDPAKAGQGQTVNVSGEAAEELLKRGWALDPATGALADEATPTSSATPKVGEGEGEPPDLDAMTKEELHEHAKANAIEGVTMAQNKDDMLRAIKRASRTR